MITRGKNSRARLLRRTGTALTALAVAAGVLVGCTSADQPSVQVPELPTAKLPGDVVTQMQDATNNAVRAFGGSGAIVGVWAPWSGSWVGAVGTTSTTSKTAVTTDMSFRIGPVTREVTCDALYAMAKQRVVKLDDPVTKYVIGMKGFEKVQLRHLCDGTAGIAATPAAIRADFVRTPDRVWRPRELASFGLGQPRLNAPGEAYAESNTGYQLLGLALERATDMTASEYIAKYVTGPLGLTTMKLPAAASAAPTPSPALGGQLVEKGKDGAYACAAPRDVTKSSSSIGYTDSGMTGTILELGKYARATAAGSLTDGDTGDRFSKPLQVSKDGPSWYGASGGSLIAGTLVGQSGGTLGYSTAAFSDPKSGLTVAVVINNSTNPDAARLLAFQLAAMASKLPASPGKAVPEKGLPWTAAQYQESITKSALCAPKQ